MDARRSCLMAMLVCVAGLVASCATTRLTADVRDPAYRGGPIRSVLVVAVSDDPEV